MRQLARVRTLTGCSAVRRAGGGRGVRAPLGVLLIAALLLAGCGGGSANLPKGAEGRTRVSIVLDWYPWANHSGLFLAQSRGYFKQEALEVDIHPPGNPEDILKVVAAGTDQFGISYQPDVLSARAAGVPVKSIAALVQHPLNTVMTPRGSGITRPKDLEGKKVGTPGLPSNEAMLRTMLQTDGGSIERVELVNVGFDLVPALLGRKVDAIIGAYAVHEGVVAELQGQPVDIMRVQDWGVPDYYELVLVTNDNMVKQQPEVVRKFVRAASRGYADAIADGGAALEALATAHKETDRRVEGPAIARLAPLWTDGVPQFGTQTAERWQRYADWMRSRGLLDKPVKMEDCFTTEFLPKS
ncbi:MAG: ABC transporter substrate-binding protein [Chloroflexota bacterium]|nr:ABC transporter substrate-binding protein [Chloroflexota bacterium]